jgi:hypothetical protein
MDHIDTGWEVEWILTALDKDKRQIQEYGNDILGVMSCRKFLDYLRNCQLVKKDSAPCSQLFSYLYLHMFLQ